MGEFVGIIIAIVVCFLLFLALREVVLWYWKVDTIIKNQEVTNKLLHHNNALLNEQIAFMKSQVNQELRSAPKDADLIM